MNQLTFFVLLSLSPVLVRLIVRWRKRAENRNFSDLEWDWLTAETTADLLDLIAELKQVRVGKLTVRNRYVFWHIRRDSYRKLAQRIKTHENKDPYTYTAWPTPQEFNGEKQLAEQIRGTNNRHRQN